MAPNGSWASRGLSGSRMVLAATVEGDPQLVFDARLGGEIDREVPQRRAGYMVEWLGAGKPVDPVLQVNPVSLPHKHKGGQPFSLDRDTVPLQEPLQSRALPDGPPPGAVAPSASSWMLLQSNHRSIGGETTPPVVDGDPVSVEHDPLTLVEWHRHRRRHPAGQHRGPHRVVEPEPPLGVRERLDRPVPGEPILQAPRCWRRPAVGCRDRRRPAGRGPWRPPTKRPPGHLPTARPRRTAAAG